MPFSSLINLYPCLILLILSYIIPVPSKGLKITLIPPHSPESPAYLGNLTVSKKIQKLIRQSRGRVQILSSSLFPTGILNHSSVYNESKDLIPPVEGINLGGDSGFVYIAKIGIGTFDDEPKYKTYYLHLDTGSTLTWLQCAECQKPGNTCFQQVVPLFRNSLSHSFRPLMENSAMCTSAPPNPNPRSLCYYNVEYGDGAKSSGLMAYESFTFKSDTPATYYSPSILFGCGFDQKDFSVRPDEPEKAAGIMGLGGGNDALHVQLDHYHIGLRFSYCFQDLLNKGGGPQRPTYLQFIEEDIQDDPSSFQETAFHVPSSSTYCVRVINIKIDDNSVPMIPLDTVIIDSGTSITHLINPVYDSMVDTLLSWLKSRGSTSPKILQPTGLTDDPTFCIGKTPSLGFNTLPSIHLLLEGGGDFEIKREQGFIVWTDDLMGNEEYFCLMIDPHDTMNIIGAFQQVNHRVIYDTKQNKLLFKNEDCANS